MARICIILVFVVLCCIFSSINASEQARKPGWQVDLVKQMFNTTKEGREFMKADDDICSWPIFACDLNMHFTSFFTYIPCLGNTIPESIAELTSLERVYIRDWHDERNLATIPSAIGDLTNLRSLQLLSFLKGTLPSSLENLKNLEELSIPNSHLTGTIPSGLGSDQPKLRIVSLIANQLTGTIPAQLVILPFRDVNDQMQPRSGLYLSYNQLTGSVPPVLSESGVEELDLSYNSLTIFEESIPRPPRLVSCYLSNNPFVCPIPQWAIDECHATCTDIGPWSGNNEGLSTSTIATIIASACGLSIVIIGFALFFSRRRKAPQTNANVNS